MPLVNIKINYTLTDEQKSQIEKGIVNILENLGKSDKWLMVFVEDNIRIYFRGVNNVHSAGITLAVYKEIEDESAEKFISGATELISDCTDIEKNRIEVIIQPVSQWGLGGRYIN